MAGSPTPVTARQLKDLHIQMFSPEMTAGARPTLGTMLA